jgi:hypothetical protein
MANLNLPIIIGGFYRSGTSLVRRLLDSHSRIHCGPEIKFFKDFYGDYLRDDLRHVRLFGTLHSLGLSEREMLLIFGKAFVESHVFAARKRGKTRWADKNPDNVLYLKQWELLLPDGFIFIHVVRNPLDALASLKEAGFTKTIQSEFSEKAQLLKRYRDAGEEFVATHPCTSLTVGYEDLVNFPISTLKSVFSSLGEPFEPEVLENFNQPERGEGIEDPKIRLTNSIHDRSVGRWRKDLEEDEIYSACQILNIESGMKS